MESGLLDHNYEYSCTGMIIVVHCVLKLPLLLLENWKFDGHLFIKNVGGLIALIFR